MICAQIYVLFLAQVVGFHHILKSSNHISLYKQQTLRVKLDNTRINDCEQAVVWRCSSFGHATLNNYKVPNSISDTIGHILSVSSTTISENGLLYSCSLPQLSFFGYTLRPLLSLNIFSNRHHNTDDSICDYLSFNVSNVKYQQTGVKDSNEFLISDSVQLRKAYTSITFTYWLKNMSILPCHLNTSTEVELMVNQSVSGQILNLPYSILMRSGNVVLQNYINSLAAKLIRSLSFYHTE